MAQSRNLKLDTDVVKQSSNRLEETENNESATKL